MTATSAGPIGALVFGDTPPDKIVDVCRNLENSGFSELWVAEDYFMLSAFASAGMALQSTRQISVGIGAISGRVRHPAVTAMEAATLAGAYPGRLKLAIGHGVPAWTAQMKLKPKSFLKSFRECTTGVKRLLNGETLNEDGEYYSYDAVTLTHPAPGLDVLGAVVGPKSTDLCAEISDGIVLSVLSGPKYVESVRRNVEKIRTAKGLPVKFDIVTYVLASVGDDGEKVRAGLRGVAGFYLDAMGTTLMTGVYGANEQLQQMIDQGGAAAIAENMPEDWMDWLTVGGTPEDCIQSIRNLFAAGTSSIVLCLMPTSDIDTQIKRFSESVLPNI
ncbi:MAG: LLM class flavin-dependent oxidoreductase [Alphaproteobacteria bacterium]|nr:LLM class flavin-dependent oxidoreductase [Alphaproteobacteria bacterium]